MGGLQLPLENRENKLSIVGIGPGDRGLRTLQAEEAIREADYVVGYRPYLDLISDLLPGKKIISSGMGREVDRAKAAVDLLEEGAVALVSSGDPNIYGMAGIGLEMAPQPENVEIIPGVTSFTAAACKVGLIFRQSVAVISLSDLLTPWQEIEGRLRVAAQECMPTALYNPRSKRREGQLLKALTIFGPDTPVLVAKNIGRQNEEIFWTLAGRLLEEEALREKIDMTTLLILGGRGIFQGEAYPESGINVVGIGPGRESQLTLDAKGLLEASERIFGADRYLQLIEGVSSGKRVAHSGPCPERMAARFKEASIVAARGKRASILTGGDPCIFSSAWRILEKAAGKSQVHISPGISAFSAVAARAGAPLVNDFALLSEPEDALKISLLAGAGFGVAAYNVRGHELQPILEAIDPKRPCVLARDVSRVEEEIVVLAAGDLLETKPIGFRFTLLIASARSYIKEGRIVARRGYDTKYSY